MNGFFQTEKKWIEIARFHSHNLDKNKTKQPKKYSRQSPRPFLRHGNGEKPNKNSPLPRKTCSQHNSKFQVASLDSMPVTGQGSTCLLFAVNLLNIFLWQKTKNNTYRTSTASNNTQATNWDTSWIQYCCSNSTQQYLYCQQQYTGNQLGHKLNPVLLQQLNPAVPLLPATIHREPTGTQAESSTAAATQPSRTSTASNNTQATNWDTSWIQYCCSNSTKQDLYCKQQYTGNKLRHKLNPVLLKQLNQARPLLPATIHREPTWTQAESSTAAATQPSSTSTASKNTQGTNWDTSWIQYCCSNSTQQYLYCQQKYTGNQLGHKLNPVLLQQLNPAVPLLPATIHRQPTGTQAESSTAAATQPSSTSTASNNTQGTNLDTSWIQYCCSNSTQQYLYCQQQYTGNQLGHKLNPVLLQQLNPAVPLLPATIHRQPTGTQAESSTAAATQPSSTSTASNNTQGTNLDTSWIQYCCSNSTQQYLYCQQKYTGNQLGHKLNPVLLQQLNPAVPLLPATIHRQPTGTQAESSTAAATQPSSTSTASNNTQGTNWGTSWIQYCCDNDTSAGPPLPATIHTQEETPLSPPLYQQSPKMDHHPPSHSHQQSQKHNRAVAGSVLHMFLRLVRDQTGEQIRRMTRVYDHIRS